MCNHFNNAMKGKRTKFQERRHMSLYETTCSRESELVVSLSLQQLLPLDFVKSVSSEKHIRVRFVIFHTMRWWKGRVSQRLLEKTWVRRDNLDLSHRLRQLSQLGYELCSNLETMCSVHCLANNELYERSKLFKERRHIVRCRRQFVHRLHQLFQLDWELRTTNLKPWVKSVTSQKISSLLSLKQCVLFIIF